MSCQGQIWPGFEIMLVNGCIYPDLGKLNWFKVTWDGCILTKFRFLSSNSFACELWSILFVHRNVLIPLWGTGNNIIQVTDLYTLRTLCIPPDPGSSLLLSVITMTHSHCCIYHIIALWKNVFPCVYPQTITWFCMVLNFMWKFLLMMGTNVCS